MSRRGRRKGRRSLALPMIIALVAVTIIVAYLIYVQGTTGPTNSSPLIGTTVPDSVTSQLTGVSFNTLNAIGRGGSGVNSPTTITSSPLTSNGKPEVLYIGGEYCPFCAVERWALIVALSKFGNFSGVQYMLSSATDTPASVPTFTFQQVTYNSNYISFVPIEKWDRSGNVRQSPTSDQQSLMSTYDSQGSIPFVYFGGKYALVGSQFQPPFPNINDNWTQIASQLNNPSSQVAQNVDGAANRIISVLCVLTSGQPSNVCAQSFAQTLSFTRGGPSVNGGGSALSMVATSQAWGYAEPNAFDAPLRATDV